MIEVKNLCKAFGKNEVLKNMNLSFVKNGSITAILGPNGSGKTTFIKCLLGMVIPDSGLIEIHGQSIEGEWEYRSKIQYLPQIARFPDNLTIKELITLIGDIRAGAKYTARLIETFGLQSQLNKKISTLSGGTKQKVNLTLAFMYDSPVVILDEPTSGLDPVAMLKLKEIIRIEKSRGKTILITTHVMSFVEEIADDLVFLLEGKVHFSGSISQVKNQYSETSVERAIACILEGKTPVSSNGKITSGQPAKFIIQ